MKKILFLLMAVLLIVSCDSKKKAYNELAGSCYMLIGKHMQFTKEYADEYIACLQKVEEIKKLPKSEQSAEMNILRERAKKLEDGAPTCELLQYTHGRLKEDVTDDSQESYNELGDIIQNLQNLSDYLNSKDFKVDDYQKKYTDVQAQIKNFGDKYPDISKAESEE